MCCPMARQCSLVRMRVNLQFWIRRRSMNQRGRGQGRQGWATCRVHWTPQSTCSDLGQPGVSALAHVHALWLGHLGNVSAVDRLPSPQPTPPWGRWQQETQVLYNEKSWYHLVVMRSIEHENISSSTHDMFYAMRRMYLCSLTYAVDRFYTILNGAVFFVNIANLRYLI